METPYMGLLNVTDPPAGADQLGPVRDNFHGLKGLAIEGELVYGSGGTTIDVWVQTSLNGGLTWIDIAQFAFGVASARRMYNLTNAAVTAQATPGDGVLANNTAVNGFLGESFRVKYTVVGTYAGGTIARVLAQPVK